MPLEFHNRTLCTTIVFYFLLRAQSGKSINARTHSRRTVRARRIKCCRFICTRDFHAFYNSLCRRMERGCHRRIYKRERGYEIYFIYILGANRSLRVAIFLIRKLITALYFIFYQRAFTALMQVSDIF
jgi:hypothetical protein